jgi:hypothetical protein
MLNYHAMKRSGGMEVQLHFRFKKITYTFFPLSHHVVSLVQKNKKVKAISVTGREDP